MFLAVLPFPRIPGLSLLSSLPVVLRLQHSLPQFYLGSQRTVELSPCLQQLSASPSQAFSPPSRQVCQQVMTGNIGGGWPQAWFLPNSRLWLVSVLA
mmetsp:Transcript_87626/g.251097  ORF Transcript_87626/g.251097 Transcript_87626/m.251097 type:complete len:97 (-) Transcript_87626:325-615(-)